VVVAAVLGPLRGQWQTAGLAGLVFLVVGIILYRRGR
jgi:hypothetical protein